MIIFPLSFFYFFGLKGFPLLSTISSLWISLSICEYSFSNTKGFSIQRQAKILEYSNWLSLTKSSKSSFGNSLALNSDFTRSTTCSFLVSDKFSWFLNTYWIIYYISPYLLTPFSTLLVHHNKHVPLEFFYMDARGNNTLF